MLKRSISGVVVAALCLLFFYLGGPYLLMFCALLSVLALTELKNAFEKRGTRLYYVILLCLAVGFYVLRYFCPDAYYYTLGAGFVVLCIALLLTHKTRKLEDLTASIFALVYAVFGFAVLYEIGKFGRNGFALLILLFVGVWFADMFAYFGGSLFGKHKLTEISPKKTWEGVISGLIFGAGASICVCLVFPGCEWYFCALTGVFCAVLGLFGDLLASYIKRQCDIKDFGKIIPGHGGVLDRFDSILLTAPAVLALALLFGYCV